MADLGLVRCLWDPFNILLGVRDLLRISRGEVLLVVFVLVFVFLAFLATRRIGCSSSLSYSLL